MLLGAHLSIAGGMHHALVSASEYGLGTVAVFVRNQRQWKGPPLSEQTVAIFRRTRRRLGISPVVAHASYLLNLAGGEPVRSRSIAAMRDDLDRCGRLGIEYLVFHPGSHEDRAAGAAWVAEALNRVIDACPHRRPKILLETPAGAGRCLGGTFEELADILSRLAQPQRFGVCLDTCHVFAAGYDLRTPPAYRATMRAFDEALGLGKLLAIHLNDSLGPLGSHVDRHTHIGRGAIGRRGFANLVADPALAEVPMILETPKGADARGRDWDRLNADTIRRLARAHAKTTERD